MQPQTLAVFCGSRAGNNELYEQHAIELGTLIGQHSMALVYGGGNKGLMSAVANATLAAGGKVTGVIPEVLTQWEHQHNGLTELFVVKNMHERKRMMYELCDAAIILPGGFGTMDELFEMVTWNSLNIHNKKIILLNSAGYYDALFVFINKMFEEGFLWADWKDRIKILETPNEIFSWMAADKS